MYKILVLVLDGVVDSSLALTYDSIATANRLGSVRRQGVKFSTRFFHPGRKRIRTGMGASVSVSSSARVGDYDALVIPGLGLATPREISQFFEGEANRRIVDWLRKSGPKCHLIGASCSAVFLLAESGLLDGQAATTTWWLGAAFRDRYPAVDLDEGRMLVESDGIVCAGAALAQIDLMLHLISRAGGPDLSRDVARFLAIDERPSQARYMMLSAVAGRGQEVRRIEAWIRQNRSRSFSMAEMAKSLGMSTRTLDRRVRLATGKGPSRFVQQLRMEHAMHLIETSNLSMSQIAGEVGYREATTLRRLLQRHLGMNPTELRKRSV